MAKALNLDRVRDSRLVAAVTVLLYLFSSTLIPIESLMHESLEYIGYFLVMFCAIGRVYCSAFLGGYKNEKFITYGPFSVARNPLYFFSLVGIVGLSVMSNHIVIMLINPLLFVVMYLRLIRREEQFLTQRFGDAYASYCSTVPRLLPKLSLYQAPPEISVRPQFLNNAVFDAVWWFVPYPLFELIEYFQEIQWIPTLFLIP